MVICCLFSWPNKLVCSQRMPAGVGDWLGYWNEPGEKKVGGDSPFHLLGMGTGGMGGHNRFPSIELRMRELDFRSSRRGVALPPVDLLA